MVVAKVIAVVNTNIKVHTIGGSSNRL